MKKVILLAVIVLIAIVAGVWYFVASPKQTTTQLSGVIKGETTYPSEGVPALTVCAQSVSEPKSIKCIDVLGQNVGERELPKFSLSVKPGKYWVYAELANPADLGLTESTKAYYTEFVRCGMELKCKDHTKIEINVSSGQTVTGIVPGDWYE